MIYPSKSAWDSAQQIIRERAYDLWERCGRPDGEDKVMWARARDGLERERRAVASNGFSD